MVINHRYREKAAEFLSRETAGELAFAAHNRGRDVLQELDLHGLTVPQAIEKVEALLDMHQGSAEGCTCHLIVGHGKGRKGPAKIKKEVQKALSSRPGVTCCEDLENAGRLIVGIHASSETAPSPPMSHPIEASSSAAAESGPKRKKGKKGKKNKDSAPSPALEDEEDDCGDLLALMMEEEDPHPELQEEDTEEIDHESAKRTSKAQKRREKKEAAEHEAELAAESDVFADTSEDAVASIMAMGFDEASARRALRGGQTVERALESLLG